MSDRIRRPHIDQVNSVLQLHPHHHPPPLPPPANGSHNGGDNEGPGVNVRHSSRVALGPSDRNSQLNGGDKGGIRESGRVTQHQRESLMNANLWKAYLYELQLQAPTPKRIVSTRPESYNRPTYYGREYHGTMSREEAEAIVGKGEDGRYLVRESVRSKGQFTLSVRFNEGTKNYRLHYFDGKHFFGEKRFDTIHDLVADALISLYLDLHAGDYIASLGQQCKYEESPYMTLHKRPHLGVRIIPGQKRALGHYLPIHEAPSAAPPVPSSKHSTGLQTVSSVSSTSSNGSGGSCPTTIIGVKPPVPLVKPVIPSVPIMKPRKKPSQPPPPPPNHHHPLGNQKVNFEALRISNYDPSMEEEDEEDGYVAGDILRVDCDALDVAHYDKPHSFRVHNFLGLPFCDFCGNFMWGIIGQGVKCDDCSFSAHKKCSEKVPNDCCPDLSSIRRVYGIDLTTLVKACGSVRPFVVDACVKEIENRGLHVEGLYRVSGFADDVDSLKLRLESEGSESGCESILRSCDDVHVITGALKMYFRLLPVPVITFDCYPHFMAAIRRSHEPEKVVGMRESIGRLPPAHLQTLKYFLNHLVKVAGHSDENLMNAYNLSTVFCPTLMKTPNISLMPFQVNSWQQEAEVIEFLITHFNQLFK